MRLGEGGRGLRRGVRVAIVEMRKASIELMYVVVKWM